EAGDVFNGDRLPEYNPMQSPLTPIGEYDPLYALVRPIINCLTKMPVAQSKSGSLHFDKQTDLAINSDGQVAICSTYLLLTRDFIVFVESEYVSQHVLNDGHSVGF